MKGKKQWHTGGIQLSHESFLSEKFNKSHKLMSRPNQKKETKHKMYQYPHIKRLSLQVPIDTKNIIMLL